MQVDPFREAQPDIDDIVAHKMKFWEVTASILLAYGKYDHGKIAQICNVSRKTVGLLSKKPESIALQAHFKLIEYYHNVYEYTQMRKLSIAASNKVLEIAIDKNDYKMIKKSADAILKLLKPFE